MLSPSLSTSPVCQTKGGSDCDTGARRGATAQGTREEGCVVAAVWGKWGGRERGEGGCGGGGGGGVSRDGIPRQARFLEGNRDGETRLVFLPVRGRPSGGALISKNGA